MNAHPIRFFYDYVDPVSYLLELELQAAEKTAGILVERIPFELRPPPEPMVDPTSSAWTHRLAQAAGLASDLDVHVGAPTFVPWTRKAHELALHAAEHTLEQETRQAIYEGVFVEGLDIGRVDVLVTLGVRLGLDANKTKAVLDVDRYSDDVTRARETALAAGITQVPCLVKGAQRLEGFHNRHALGTFLHASGTPDNTTD